ncbi:MAG: ABC transporter permease [Oscillospiraceae bacterium]|nr:ABC transporter permease [Oscillospiraceae bacterium]MDD6503011.1 ABC transporter permease [Oscillospiraceae bacterium]MDY4105081.1 ABC transporter permease [Oscillospiraceae bacterium]
MTIAKRRKKSLSEYSTGELVMYRFRKNKLAMFGVVLLCIVAVAVMLAPVLSSYEAVSQMHVSDRFTAPNKLYIFGTDEFGRDLFARVLYGGRISLLCSFAIIGIAFVVGAVIGGAAGYFGGKVDSVLMRFVDMLMAVPSTLLAMAIITALGNGVWKLVVALAISQIARFARIVRSAVLTLRNVEYIEAAKCYGCSSLRIILKHILPNGIGPIIVSATLCLGQTILSISSMGYLGLGVASPTPEWGTIISENKMNIQAYPYLGLIPGICICLTVMAVNFIGDGLRDAFDPRTKN